MKKLSFYLKFILLAIVAIISFDNIYAQTICSNQIGNQGEFTYEYWKDNGNGCMQLNNGGAFSINWNNINNLLARKGKRPGSKNQTITYGADYQPNGNSFLCVYGWTTSPLVEYYIVDSWGSWRPPGSGFKGTVNSDGATYDIYETIRVNKPSIQGNQTFKQFWSVRRSKRTSGTITCVNHFNAWEQNGMRMGDLYEVSMTVEGYQSSGFCNIYNMSMGTSNDNSGDNGDGSSESNTIVIRAKGVSGSERINLQVNNNTIATHTLSTEYQNYMTSTNANGGINIQYFNDSWGRDVQVDWVSTNGNIRQAEDQSYNTAVWQNGSCGGSYSEWMHCNGILGFGNTKTLSNQDSTEVIIKDFIVYPNPSTNGQLNLSFTGFKSSKTIQVLDLTGKIIRQVDNVTAQDYILNLSENSGIFLVKINDGQKTVIKKIVIS